MKKFQVGERVVMYFNGATQAGCGREKGHVSGLSKTGRCVRVKLDSMNDDIWGSVKNVRRIRPAREWWIARPPINSGEPTWQAYPDEERAKSARWCGEPGAEVIHVREVLPRSRDGGRGR